MAIEYQEIEIAKIRRVENIRTNLEEIPQLMTSIKQDGLLMPIGVWQEGEEYIISYGNRRLEACKQLGWKTIPALVSNTPLDEENFLIRNVVENLQRLDNSPIELGRVVSKLRETMSMEEIAARLSINSSRLSVALGLYNNAPEGARKYIGYKDSKANRNSGKVSVTAASSISNSGLVPPMKERIFAETRKRSLDGRKVGILIQLLKHGVDIDSALTKLDEYELKNFQLLVNKNAEQKFMMDTQERLNSLSINKILNGTLPLQTDMFVNPKVLKNEMKNRAKEEIEGQ
jgi:ParB/RepB/Spo0J family partition protein